MDRRRVRRADGDAEHLRSGDRHVGKPVRVQVTGSKPDFTSVTKESDLTGPVIGTLTSTPTPTVTGTPKLGVPLTANAGTWDAGAALAYQWTAENANIPGSHRPDIHAGARRPGEADQGQGDRHQGLPRSRYEGSDPTAAVATGDLTSTPTPTVAGTPVAGAS